MNTSTIAFAKSDEEIRACFPVMVQLRTHLVETDFLGRIRGMEKESYQLAYLKDPAGVVRSVAGLRKMNMLFSGRTIYVDDLVTDAATRSHGYGDALVDWLVAYARAEGFDEFSLDSGTQRVDAHRFYLRKRMKISSFHFSLPLKK